VVETATVAGGTGEGCASLFGFYCSPVSTQQALDRSLKCNVQRIKPARVTLNAGRARHDGHSLLQEVWQTKEAIEPALLLWSVRCVCPAFRAWAE